MVLFSSSRRKRRARHGHGSRADIGGGASKRRPTGTQRRRRDYKARPAVRARGPAPSARAQLDTGASCSRHQRTRVRESALERRPSPPPTHAPAQHEPGASLALLRARLFATCACREDGPRLALPTAVKLRAERRAGLASAPGGGQRASRAASGWAGQLRRGRAVNEGREPPWL